MFAIFKRYYPLVNNILATQKIQFIRARRPYIFSYSFFFIPLFPNLIFKKSNYFKTLSFKVFDENFSFLLIIQFFILIFENNDFISENNFCLL